MLRHGSTLRSLPPEPLLLMDAVLAHPPTTIFTAMSGLARELGAINLGQGFPDDPGQ